MKKPFQQGFFDGLCSVYSVCNSYQITNNASDEETEMLFREIIIYLQKKRKLSSTILDGMYASNLKKLIDEVVKVRFIEVVYNYNWRDYTLDAFWMFSQRYLSEPNTAMILSVGGRENHFTTVEKMTDKTMFLVDSSGLKRINKSQIKLQGYTKKDKYVVYPNQCFYLKGKI